MKIGVDLDHTVCDAAWRDGYIDIAHEMGDWDQYHSKCVDDKPAKVIINLLIALHNAGHEIFIVTARPRKWLRHTYSWLHKNGVLIEQDHILMRDYNDFHPAIDTKLLLVDGLNLDLMIEDREDICRAFGEAGIATLQVRLVS